MARNWAKLVKSFQDGTHLLSGRHFGRLEVGGTTTPLKASHRTNAFRQHRNLHCQQDLKLMAGDEMSQVAVSKRFALRPVLLTVIILALIFAGLSAWLGLLSSPDGGEPVVVLKIPGEKTPPPQAADGEDTPAIRKTLLNDEKPEDQAVMKKPAEPPADSTAQPDRMAGSVRIIDPMRQSARQPLARAPINELLETSTHGPIPRIADDGRRPSRLYARPSRLQLVPGRPAPARIAIVIGGLGISASGTAKAISGLPEEVTLAFAPYGRELQSWADKARRDGHEVMLHLPMEPFDYPDNDPGPHTLLSNISHKENQDRLLWMMSRFGGYFAVTNYMGARFTSSPQALEPVMRFLAEHGVAWLDDGASPHSQTGKLSKQTGLKVASADIVIDAGQTPQSISQALKQLERHAGEKGLAVGVGAGLPLTMEMVTAWTKTLKDKGIVLVPASAAFNTQGR